MTQAGSFFFYFLAIAGVLKFTHAEASFTVGQWGTSQLGVEASHMMLLMLAGTGSKNCLSFRELHMWAPGCGSRPFRDTGLIIRCPEVYFPLHL